MVMSDEALASSAKSLIVDAAATAAGLRTLVDDTLEGRGVLGFLVRDDEARRELAKVLRMVSGDSGRSSQA